MKERVDFNYVAFSETGKTGVAESLVIIPISKTRYACGYISLNWLRAQQEDPLKTISQMFTSTSSSSCYYHSGCWPAERQRDRAGIVYLQRRADVQKIIILSGIWTNATIYCRLDWDNNGQREEERVSTATELPTSILCLDLSALISKSLMKLRCYNFIPPIWRLSLSLQLFCDSNRRRTPANNFKSERLYPHHHRL